MSKASASIAATIAVTALATVATAQSGAVRNEDSRASAPAAPGHSMPTSDAASVPAAGTGNIATGGANTAAAVPPTLSLPVSAAASPEAQQAPRGENPSNAGPVEGVASTQAGAVQTAPAARPKEQLPPPQLRSYRFSASVDLANVIWRTGHGYDLFSKNDAAWRFGLSVGYDALRLPASLTVAVEAGLLHEPTSDSNLRPAFGSLEGSMSATTLLLGTSLRWAWTPWLAPYGRVGLHATRVSMDFDATGTAQAGLSGTSWSHRKWTEGALFGAGVLASLPSTNPVSFGVLVEGGLWLQRSVDIQLERDLPGDAIPTSGARVGTLENTGPYVRVAGVMRF